VFSKENAGKKEGNHFTPTLVLSPQLGGGEFWVYLSMQGEK